MNDNISKKFFQPKTLEERNSVCSECCTALKIKCPVVVDDIDDRVGHAYSGMPDRLYIVDTQGKVAYKGGRGPGGYKPAEMEQTLIMLLLEEHEQRMARTIP